MVGTLSILVALVRIEIGNGSVNPGRFDGRPSMSPFLAIFYENRDTTKARINKLREIFFKCIYSWDKNIPVSVSVEFETF